MKSNILLLGPVGSGKTTSLRTATKTHQLFVLSLEPGIEHILTHSDTHCHWHYIPPARTEWSDFLKEADNVNRYSIEQLQKMKQPLRAGYRQFIELLETCNNFTCSICKKPFGDVAKLGPDCLLALDSMSGLNIMAMDIVAGGNPIKTLPDYQIAMNNVEKFIQKLCVDTTCSFCLTAHVEREIDEVFGGTKITMSTIGRRMSPRLPRFFDEVVLCLKKGEKFLWSTTEPNTDLKNRLLPLSGEITPSFANIFTTTHSKENANV
jgi:hypothetical protein